MVRALRWFISAIKIISEYTWVNDELDKKASSMLSVLGSKTLLILFLWGFMLFFSPTGHCWFRICLSAIKIPYPFLMHSTELLLLLFSRSVVSDSLQPHGVQYARVPHPSSSLRACSNSCLLSWWCHPTISSSVVPFSCLQSFPALGSFQLFASGGQSIGASASAPVLPMNIQGWFSLGFTGLIFLL